MILEFTNKEFRKELEKLFQGYKIKKFTQYNYDNTIVIEIIEK